MRVLNDLAKIAITWPFWHFRIRCLRQNVFQCLHFICVEIRGKCHLRQFAFGPFKRGLLFGGFLKNFPWSLLCTFIENASFGWPCKKCHNLAIRALLEPPSAPKSSPVFGVQVDTYYRIMTFSPVLLSLWSEGYFLGDFLKVSLGLPFAFFPKMRVLGDLPKIAITWPFGHLWSRCLLLNLFQFLVFKCILIIGYCHLRHSAFWRFQRGHPFGRFLKNFPWSRVLLEPFSASKSFPIFALEVHTN